MYTKISNLNKLPFRLLMLILLSNIIGIYALQSSNNGEFFFLPYKQLVSFFIFSIIAIFISILDLKIIYKKTYLIYLTTIIFLLLTYMIGYKAMGATRWLGIMGFSLQTSEVSKIALVLFLAKYYHDLDKSRLQELKSLLIPTLSSLLPALLIIKQPDLGTGIIVLLVFISMIFVSGINFKYILYLFIPVVIVSPFLWNILHEYQKKRVLMFLNPESDPLGSGYNIIQSKIAIGSGGVFGKGYLEGSQSNLNFLPEHHTDFIFAGFAEEHGLLGCIIILIIYFMIIFDSLAIAINARSVFGKMVVTGITTIFFLHIIINIGMISGLLPVVGIPLPFFSYGRTMMGMMLIGFGLIMNIHINQKVNFTKQ